MADFTGFRFGNIHSDELNLIVTSTSDRYSKSLMPNISDYTVAVPGGNGNYYFGSTFGNQEFTVSIAFNDIDELTWRKISIIFSTDQLKDLVFDELPYKTYKAKVQSKPDFKYVCFNDDEKGRIYKGEGTLKFVCYNPFAYCFNKYIIRAADYYLNTPPEQIIKSWYNVDKNKKIWKGGYPTLEQVQKGELFFNSPEGQETLIDVRNYWINVPEWAYSSRLLLTPTLDYDQELMFSPQISKVAYLNLDKGFEQKLDTQICSNRLFVYNSGDMPIEFNLDLQNLSRVLTNPISNRFRIRRLNVQRLDIANAIKWCNLKTENSVDDPFYKYDKKYFKVIDTEKSKEKLVQTEELQYYDMTNLHPYHCLMIEPIPRQKLAHYIRIFYYQSELECPDCGLTNKQGEKIALRYQELYNLCITNEEQYQLYWETLIKYILQPYYYQINQINTIQNSMTDNFDYNNYIYNYTFDEFVNDFIYNPNEYFVESNDLNYDEIDFNITKMPQYYTNDYLELEFKEQLPEFLAIDTENRMLYNNSKGNSKYDYTLSKNILNDYISKGHWFKIPTGWSVIEIVPVVESEDFFGKTWTHARDFDWGYSDINLGENNAQKMREKFNQIYEIATKHFVKIYNQEHNTHFPDEQIRKWFLSLQKQANNNFIKQLYYRKTINTELQMLKTIQLFWSLTQGEIIQTDNQSITLQGTIDEWWWYACNYIWSNFPPTYWSYANLLDNAKIEYTPLYY